MARTQASILDRHLYKQPVLAALSLVASVFLLFISANELWNFLQIRKYGERVEAKVAGIEERSISRYGQKRSYRVAKIAIESSPHGMQFLERRGIPSDLESGAILKGSCAFRSAGPVCYFPGFDEHPSTYVFVLVFGLVAAGIVVEFTFRSWKHWKAGGSVWDVPGAPGESFFQKVVRVVLFLMFVGFTLAIAIHFSGSRF